MTIAVGQKAPIFNLPTDGNGMVNLSDLLGKNVVLYFYPKDNTPGCTQEAKDFKDNIKLFKDKNTVIIGVSKDNVVSHDKFKNKYELPFILASDEDLKTCNDYGIWVEKSMYGKKYMGIERSTFIISPQGKIQNIWRKVKVKGHVNEVLEAIK
mgnify:CR=1 FL=1